MQRKFGQIRSKAHRAGVIITHHGNDDLVLLSAEAYGRLKEQASNDNASAGPDAGRA